MKNPIARSELEAVKKKVGLFLQVHRYEAAEKLLKSTLSAYGSLANLHNLLGLTYHKQSRFVDAIEQFELARKDNPNYTEATLNLTATLCDLSRYEEAREIYATLKSDERTGKRHPKMVLGRIANMHASLARTYQECNMLPEAIKSLAISRYARCAS